MKRIHDFIPVKKCFHRNNDERMLDWFDKNIQTQLSPAETHSEELKSEDLYPSNYDLLSSEVIVPFD